MRKIDLLCAEQDLEVLQPLTDRLRSKGVQMVKTQSPGKNSTVLAVLSENFYADEEKAGALLDLIGSGSWSILPLKLDGADIPDRIMNSLYSRNIIMPEGRDTELIAERIVSALPVRKSRMPLIFSAAGIILLAVIGLVIWRSLQGRQTAATATEEPAQIIYDLPAGLTAEDLEKIVDVIIVGEQFEYYTNADLRNGVLPDFDYYAYRDHNESGAHWYSREDGHEYSMTRYDDLRFLEMMPNLRFLTMANIETGLLPELSKISGLRNLMLMDCIVPDLEWVRGAGITKADIINSTGSISDFNPLTSCAKLADLHIDLIGTQQADLSRLAPPALDRIWINNAFDLQDGLDLSGLAACSKLRQCELDWLPVTDLSFLAGASNLELLRTQNLERLRDISALSGLEKLRDLNIDEPHQVRDFSPISECKALQNIFIECDRGQNPLRDVSFLAGLPKLRSINLGGVEIRNLDFLFTLGESRTSLDNFGVWGTVDDYSGLSAIKNYTRLNIDPDPGARLENILPYIENASIRDLSLRRFADVDISALPKIIGQLELDRCGITDLGSMPQESRFTSLNLNKCSNLRSLDGLERQSVISRLEIYQCPRLTDWSALESIKVTDLNITGCYTLPAFDKIVFSTLHLERMEDVTDLEFLSGMDAGRSYNFEFVALDGLKSLQPLYRFHGSHLAVSPQLGEQAEDLVAAGNFREYRIEYPEGGWEQDNTEMSLLSLDELDTLPPALLRHVTRLCLVGDTVIDISNGNVWEDWNEKGITIMYHPYDSDEPAAIQYGNGFSDVMEKISALTGLKDLRLYRQPIGSLDGIQNFAELEELQIFDCDKLTDASAAFACPNLRSIRIDNCPITSIQGIQNLWDLNGLNINGTKVSDLSPLAACDFAAAEANGGMWLFLNSLPAEDYSPLAGIPLQQLDINNTNAALFVPYLKGSGIRHLQAGNCFTRNGSGDPDALFAELARDNPQLEYISIGWNEDLTDLTPLLELEDLQTVRVSDNMEKAIASLEGRDYIFELEIED